LIKVIYAQSPLDIEGKSIFLAGPTPRDANVKGWRQDFIERFKKHGFKGTILLPEFEDLKDFTKDFAYDKQIEWEHRAMQDADIILFWIPRVLPDMPGFTTNTEYGYWLAKEPSKIRLGIPQYAVKCDYIRFTAKQEGILVHKVPTSLIRQTIKELN